MNYRSNRPWATKVLLAFGALAVSYVLCGYTRYCTVTQQEDKSCNPPNCDGRGWFTCPNAWTSCVWIFLESHCIGDECKDSSENPYECCVEVPHKSSTDHTCKYVWGTEENPSYCQWIYRDTPGFTCR